MKKIQRFSLIDTAILGGGLVLASILSLGNISRWSVWFDAVSYTHLDVYKRQLHYLSGLKWIFRLPKSEHSKVRASRRVSLMHRLNSSARRTQARTR